MSVLELVFYDSLEHRATTNRARQDEIARSGCLLLLREEHDDSHARGIGQGWGDSEPSRAGPSSHRIMSQICFTLDAASLENSAPCLHACAFCRMITDVLIARKASCSVNLPNVFSGWYCLGFQVMSPPTNCISTLNPNKSGKCALCVDWPAKCFKTILIVTHTVIHRNPMCKSCEDRKFLLHFTSDQHILS